MTYLVCPLDRDLATVERFVVQFEQSLYSFLTVKKVMIMVKRVHRRAMSEVSWLFT